MKISNWCKKLSATLVASGVLAPAVSSAINIPLGDPSFELYDASSHNGGFAYAQPNPAYGYTGAYRPPTSSGPPSPWVDDLDSPSGYAQDDVNSNWLYTSTYGESSASHRRAAPRTGNQAMHGLRHYNAQETGAIFEAGRTYTFSVWAQGDIDATIGAGSAGSSRAFLYLFDGSVPFSEANSLIVKRFAPDTGDFVNRDPSWTPAQSMANWKQISLSHTVLPGGSEIGHPVGVAFWVADDGALDDASLSSVVPEPTTVVLVGLGGLMMLGRRRRE